MEKAKREPGWDARRIKALRDYLKLTQADMARQMGIRQQTISEWELGPRGASASLLSIIADRGGFKYTAEKK
jgi:DNA-binding transcriptional regulator YiaG